MRYILPANAGACLSSKSEFAQEHEQIRQVQFIENMRVYMQRIRPEGSRHEVGGWTAGRGQDKTLNLIFSALFSFMFF